MTANGRDMTISTDKYKTIGNSFHPTTRKEWNLLTLTPVSSEAVNILI